MFSDRIWSQMQFTIKWSLVSLVFSEIPGPEWLHVRSFFFGHGDHDFLVCFDTRIVGLIAECTAVHLQWLEDAGNSQQIYKQHLALKEFSQSIFLFRRRLSSSKCSFSVYCKWSYQLPSVNFDMSLCQTVTHTHMRRIWNPPIRNVHIMSLRLCRILEQAFVYYYMDRLCIQVV